MASALVDREPREVSWQAEPYHPWSLLDMLHVCAAQFSTVLAWMYYVHNMWQTRPENEARKIFLEGGIDRVIDALDAMPVSMILKVQIRRLKEKAEAQAGVQEMQVLLNEMENNFITDLGNHRFLWIPPAHKDMYMEPERWFGEKTVVAFPDATRDVRDAARCLALEQWSASVFHAMAVMEWGLRKLAARVQVVFAQSVELENWHNIIEQIESRIRAMKQVKREDQNPAEIKFCSEAASHFFAVKEAWRNHVSHLRGRYDEQEAWKIMTNVRDFMRVLAA